VAIVTIRVGLAAGDDANVGANLDVAGIVDGNASAAALTISIA